MKNLSKTLSLIVAIFFVFIGALHLMVHFQDLTTPALAAALQGDTQVMGSPAPIWKMWQGFSVMMGWCFIIIGALQIGWLWPLKAGQKPSKGASIAMLALLAGVIYSGHAFFGPEQFYGGMFGFTLQGVALYFSFEFKKT
ncbi:MAG: hypothetical protein AAGH79_09920 [Bacteroidota bacterium]